MSGRVLVTGGTGFIGSAAVAALRAAGFPTLAGARRAGAEGAIACDLDDPAETLAALQGVDVVVHAALGDNAAAERQTRTLLAAMRQAGAPALIALSSIAVYGAAEGRVDEAAPPSGALDPYARAKRACEARARAWAEAGEGGAILLRPGAVYGAGSRFWIEKPAERIRLGAWGSFGASGEGAAPLIHVDDVAGAIVAAAKRPPARGAVLTMNLVGPARPSWNDYFQALADRLGAGALPRWSAAEIACRQALALPAKLARRAGLAADWVRAAALAPTPGEVALFARRADYVTDAAREFGLDARIGLDEGLARSKLR